MITQTAKLTEPHYMRPDISILEKIKQCRLCQHQLPFEPRPILQFNKKSKILIAGQAPGQVTHKKGRPFDDKSGERLRLWLGVDDADFYDENQFAIVPMGFCYPGKGKSGDLPPLALCAETWRIPIVETLSNVELTLILGKHALDWHIKYLASHNQSFDQAHYKNLTEAIKDADNLMQYGLVVLPHPSPRNNIWLKKNPWFEQEVIPRLKQRVSVLLAK